MLALMGYHPALLQSETTRGPGESTKRTMPAPFYNEIRKIGDLIREIRICMLATVDEDGYPHSRPMAAQQVEFDGDLWFSPAGARTSQTRLRARSG
jgi:Pyridoxamine 5'-phosphate oxidase like